ncbi:P-loop containing nucleoside triphosphate hydrolase protein [Annulohypoxylon truncatum]|uniref:P-loop containing nucleoside triphosphate hydrolase protein n=1 Tax=Annulohypoxylon truncatum TaxID=327061 RepID=UPI002007A9FE|nr:P-loop containing nucleoside triphosphate hydrolase protein [Annulohypoxylon truncatum]KAI1206715.1 P-loop containing nucleoside triphosphate hydrolase protein [Annulohypoxylon truncatum]
MTLDIASAINACSVDRYRSVIQQSYSQEQADASVTPQQALKHGINHKLDTPTKSTDKVQESPMGKLKVSLGEQEKIEEQRYLYLSDSSSAETPHSSSGRKKNCSRKKAASRSCKLTANQCRRTGQLGLCDSEEECNASDTSASSLDSEPNTDDPGKRTHEQKMKKWKKLARGKFEEMLLECIVNTDNIPPDYENIFLDREVIEKVEKATALGLKRPKAFSHGVLKNNKVTGAILYGPPGTGKTLLARGVAKQSGFNMLSISTSEVWQKCHGDDEKMIQAVFSMARKMYPTIVFIDEADGLLGERKAGEKRHLRAMLNKFLMEWDGIMSGTDSPFILLATNRPNDLDPAVMRRAPVRIHFNLPTKQERLGILGLLLKDETLGPDITQATLANLTPQYTGSDLKNLCVTAATECISEQAEDSDRRVLGRRHFMAAMRTIKATSISKTREQDLQNFQNNRQEQADE